MTNTETQTKTRGKIMQVIALLVGIGLVYFIVNFVVNERLSDLQLETKILISEQKSLLTAMAEITARGGADEVAERLVKDCSSGERNNFDDLLSRLNSGLSNSQLIELERLFGRCGSFFADRKSVMVSRLQREVEIYETFVLQLDNLSSSKNVAEYEVSSWKNLAELEAKQSALFTELVHVQDEIINSLLEGNAATSEEITQILQRANEIQETIIVTKSQASSVRSGLVSL